MKCVDCGLEVPPEEEMSKCPKCQKFSLRKIEGVVVTDPELAENLNGEKFIYFTVKTHDREVPVEVKQGFEIKPPVEKGDEVVVECYRLKERTDALRVNKLENKRLRIIYNYKGGCLMPLVGLLLILLTAFWSS
ncbi:MAG: hypothetical protein ACYC21_05115 [Eubacteriales bacterium]